MSPSSRAAAAPSGRMRIASISVIFLPWHRRRRKTGAIPYNMAHRAGLAALDRQYKSLIAGGLALAVPQNPSVSFIVCPSSVYLTSLASGSVDASCATIAAKT